MRFNPLASVLSVLLALAGCSGESEKATESVTLPSGEVITNDSSVYYGRDTVRYNRLYFQLNASASRETLCEIFGEGIPVLSLRDAKPKILKSGERVGLVVGEHVFQRWTRKEGPYWYHASTDPDPTASLFLRSFLKPGDKRVVAAAAGPARASSVSSPTVRYVFHELDLDHNVLVTRRDSPDTDFPEFLAYSAERYGFTFRFDMDRTRSLNGLKPPADADLVIDFSVVTRPGPGRPGLNEARETALAAAGAREVYARTAPLDGGTWARAEYSLAIPSGATVNDRFDALLGFKDPLPQYVCVFWRAHPVLWTDSHLVRVGEWVTADASGYAGDLSRLVFFRVRRAATDGEGSATRPARAVR